MYFHDDSTAKFVLQTQQGFVGAYHSNPGKLGIIALAQGHPLGVQSFYIVKKEDDDGRVRGKLLFLFYIVISRRASVTAMIVQLHFDRRRRVFGIFLTRSHSYSRWAHLQHILDLLTTNHSDHGPVKWQCLSSLDYDAEEQF